MLFGWVLKTHINVIWHDFGSTADSRFSDLVYFSYVFYILNIRNGLTKNVLQRDKMYCFKCQKIGLSLHLCQSVFRAYFESHIQNNLMQIKYKLIFFVYRCVSYLISIYYNIHMHPDLITLPLSYS